MYQNTLLTFFAFFIPIMLCLLSDIRFVDLGIYDCHQ